MKLCARRLTGWFTAGLHGLRILTLAAAPVGRISVEAGNAALAVSAGCQVLALLAHTLVDTLTVTVTLASCRRVNKAHTASTSHKGIHEFVSSFTSAESDTRSVGACTWQRKLFWRSLSLPGLFVKMKPRGSIELRYVATATAVDWEVYHLISD